MLIILLFFSLFRTLQGAPLSSPTNPLDDFSTLCLCNNESHFGQRTVNDIIISCFATIFACTWSAIHPNIPAPTDCWWTCFKRQVMIMICALLAPELITIWALRQRMAARMIAEKYNREVLKDFTGQPKSICESIKGLFRDSPLAASESSVNRPRWTSTHGFFLQMGGFMLSHNGIPMHILIDGSHSTTPKELQLIKSIEEGIISPPRITEEDIQDRSKGDIISKTIIILQTTWFIVQCIARWSQHLPVTELEVVTLGFAILNGITYALWWNKPLNVGRPVFLERERLIPTPGEIPKAIDQSAVLTTAENVAGSSKKPETEWRSMLENSIHKQERFLTRKLQRTDDAFEILRYFLQWLVRPLWKLYGGEWKARTDCVSMFYRSMIDNDHARVAAIIMLFVGTLFGLVHLIPSWFLDFASPQEMWLWRTSAVIITVAPIPMSIGIFRDCTNEFDSVETVIKGVIFFVWFIYPFARIILLIVSLTSLRSLSAASLQTIEWTTFIPHL